MLVQLPHRCSGQEIVAAFKDAIASQQSDFVRWVAEELSFETRDRKGNLVGLGGIQIVACPSCLERRWQHFGDKMWRDKRNLKIILRPVLAQGFYNAADVDIEYLFSVGHDVFMVNNPDDPAFSEYTPQFNKIIDAFRANLQAEIAA